MTLNSPTKLSFVALTNMNGSEPDGWLVDKAIVEVNSWLFFVHWNKPDQDGPLWSSLQ